jgi:hypothetical protein
MAIIRKTKYTGTIPEIDHKELVQRAFTYLRLSMRYSVVFKERSTSVSETPDAIGFQSGFSCLIECKSTRADFLADKKKFFRREPSEGMGYKRFIMAPVGLLAVAEIPDGWGLLEVYEKQPHQRSRTVRFSKDSERFVERNLASEVSYLVSAIRRLNISMAVFVETAEQGREE